MPRRIPKPRPRRNARKKLADGAALRSTVDDGGRTLAPVTNASQQFAARIADIFATGRKGRQAVLNPKPKTMRQVYVAEHRRFMERRLLTPSTYWDRRRPRWDGGCFKGVEHHSIWPKLADFIREHFVPTVLFVRFSFDSCDQTPPAPGELLCEAAVPKVQRLMLQEIEKAEKQLLQDARRYMARDLQKNSKKELSMSERLFRTSRL